MKKRRIVLTAVILAFLFVLMSFSGCGKEKTAAAPTEELTTEEAVTEEAAAASAGEVLAQIKEAEHMELSEALELSESVPAEEREKEEFFGTLGDLKNCSGRFAYQSEEGNRYVSDVEFYLSKGEIYCTVSYTGYMGEIKDGAVTGTQETGYLFESFPKGDLFGREQDFTIRFGTEKLYISWADIIEYVLDRGDGSAESVEERHATFEETGILDMIKGVIDEAYGDIPHNVYYDEKSKTLSVALAVPDWVSGLSEAVEQNNTEIFSSWQNMVSSLSSSEKDMTETAKSATYLENGIHWRYVDTYHFYLVGILDPTNSYESNNTLLWIKDGNVKFNILDTSTYSAFPDTAKKTQGNTGSSGGISGGGSFGSSSGSGTMTSGERNALGSAKDYLNTMAFSYSGLVEQLEYEGYTSSEAKYAADHCGADWNQQAVKAAKEYLDTMSFSRSELIEQLEYEGFTHSQAVYGVDQAY